MSVAKQVGSEVISSRCLKVFQDLFNSKELQIMLSKMRDVNNKMGGVGISANQVGVNRRISLIHIRPTDARPEFTDTGEIILINPKIVEENGKDTLWEGCLSVAEAGIFAQVERASSVKVEWQDETGKSQSSSFNGMLARVVQHELAHLDGKVFLQEPGLKLESLHSRSEYIFKKQKGEIA